MSIGKFSFYYRVCVTGFVLLWLSMMTSTAIADDSIQLYPPFTIPNQIVLDKKPQHLYIVVFGGTYTSGSSKVNPFSTNLGATAMYRIFDPKGGVIASGQLTFNDSLSAFVGEVSPTLFRVPGAYRIVATVSADVDGDGQIESSTSESSLKALFKYGAFIRLSENGVNAVALTNSVLKVKRVGPSSVTFELSGRDITLNPGQSLDLSISKMRATLIIDSITSSNGTHYALATLTYPVELDLLSLISLPVNTSTSHLTLRDSDRMFRYEEKHPIVVLSKDGGSFRARLSKDGAVEFSQLLYSGLFGLIQVFQDFRIEPPSANVKWYVTMRAGISFANWAAAGFPLGFTEALDALIVWESEPHIQVNWKAEKWRQIVIFATKIAEKVREYVDLIVPDMIEESYFNFNIVGGYWTKLFAEHYDEAVSAYVVAASWTIGDIEGLEFNWDQMWSALRRGEIIVSVDFIIKEVALEFRM
ncbi:hypothetical protein [Geoglobus acetivorans]|uniref:Uncharacterized protein n=1 Tax=Geoglobus acetivorans TaxID=565033 RepID=A0A0A7GGI8_GEOAI|nr:hypothetical protein GACE_1012 [Geoglobus acetivorans]